MIGINHTGDISPYTFHGVARPVILSLLLLARNCLRTRGSLLTHGPPQGGAYQTVADWLQ